MQTTLFPVLDEKTKKMPLFMTSIGYNYLELHVERPKGYDYYQWIHTSEGSGRLIVDGKSYDLLKGYGALLYPKVPHIYYPTSPGWKTEWLSFDGISAAPIVQSLDIKASTVYSLNDYDNLSGSLHHGYQILNASGAHKNLDQAGFLFDFLIQLVKSTEPINRPSSTDQYNRLSPVLNHLELHYSDPLDLNMLSELIDVSPQYLCSLFKKVTGTRPALFVNHLRISKAKEMMLNHPEKTIAGIAAAVGFESPSYFSAVFKREEKLTPGAFIRLHRLN